MRKLIPLLLLSVTAVSGSGANAAEPLEWLSKEQKIELTKLIAGYTDAFICKKSIDFSIAEKFLQQKLGDEKLSARQVAELSHMTIGVHVMHSGEFFKTKPTGAAIAAHCKTAFDDRFGPAGKLIPGLMR